MNTNTQTTTAPLLPLSAPVGVSAFKQWRYRPANSVQPAKLIRMVSPTSGGFIATFEPDLDEVGQFVENALNSHAANLAKIKALETALRNLLESVECALGISDYDCKDSLRDAEKAGELHAARAALALPSA